MRAEKPPRRRRCLKQVLKTSRNESWLLGGWGVGFLEDTINITEARQSLQIIHYAGVWPHLGTGVDVEIGQPTSS